MQVAGSWRMPDVTTRGRNALLLVLAVLVAGAVLLLLTRAPGSDEPGAPEARGEARRLAPSLRGRGGADDGATEAEAAGAGSVTIHAAVEPEGTPLRWQARLYGDAEWHNRREGARPIAEIACDEPGSVVLSAAQPGTYVVSVRPEGLRWQEHVDGIRLDAGTHLERRVVFMAPASIRGRVVNGAGDVFPGATVHLLPGAGTQRDGWPPPRAEERLHVETDEHGEYAFLDLDPGRDYAVGVVVEGYVPARRLGVRVRPAGEEQVDLLLEPAAAIEGVLLDVEGKPLAGVKIEAQRVVQETEALVQWGEEGTATTAQDGSFHLDALVPGRKKLFAVLAYEAGLTEVAQWIGAAPAGRVTNLGPWQVLPGEVRIRVLRADGSAPSASRVHVGLVEEGESDDAEADAVWMLYVFPGEDGIGVVRGLPPGRLILRASDMSEKDPAPRPRREEVAYPGGDFECEVRFDPPGAPTGREEEVEVDIECVDLGGNSLLNVAADGDIRSGGAWRSRPPDDREHRTVRGRAGSRALALFVSGGRWVEREILFDAASDGKVTLEPLNEGGRLTVTVTRAGRGVASQLLTLHQPAWQEERGGMLGTTDGEGRYVLDGLPTDRDWEVGVLVPLGAKVTHRTPVTWEGDEGKVEIVLDD